MQIRIRPVRQQERQKLMTVDSAPRELAAFPFRRQNFLCRRAGSLR